MFNSSFSSKFCFVDREADGTYNPVIECKVVIQHAPDIPWFDVLLFWVHNCTSAHHLRGAVRVAVLRRRWRHEPKATQAHISLSVLSSWLLATGGHDVMIKTCEPEDSDWYDSNRTIFPVPSCRYGMSASFWHRVSWSSFLKTFEI
jgi:hypothetical protein